MPGPKPIYTEDLHLVVDPALKADLNSFAEASHTAVAQVVRTALREYLAKPRVDLKAASELADNLALDPPGARLLPTDPKEVAKVVAAPKNPKVKPARQVLSREEREARMAAAQSWLAKGKK